MCSSAAVGTGDGLLISRQCWMGTEHRLCPGRSRDLLGVTRTFELSPAVLQHHWPDVVARDPLSEPCASTGEPGPCKPVGRQGTRVPGCVSGPQHPRGLVWLPCLHCWHLLPVLLLTSTQGWGARGRFPLHGTGTLHRGRSYPLAASTEGVPLPGVVVTSWWSQLIAEEKPGALRGEGET